jgi:hypothetical protein
MQLAEYPDRRVWAFEDLEVTRLCIDYSFLLLMSGRDGDLTLNIHAPFRYRKGERVCEAEGEKFDTVAPVLDVLHKSVSRLVVWQNGDLSVEFSDETEITVTKDWQYESWETTANGGLSSLAMLCSPHEGPPWRD